MIRRGAQLGSIGTFGLILFASAGNWFITPMSHPDAGRVHTTLVLVQAIIGVALAVWAYRRIRIESSSESRVVSADAQRSAT